MKKEKLQQLGHIIAGVITLIFGFESFEASEFTSAASHLTLAIIFMVVAGTHKWITEKLVQADVAFFFIEALTIAYSGWVYKAKGHIYPFYLFTFAATMFFVFAMVSYAVRDKPRRAKSSKRKKRRKHSTLFDPQPDDKKISE